LYLFIIFKTFNSITNNKANLVTNLFNNYITRRYYSHLELKASVSKLLSKVYNSFSNLSIILISYTKEENHIRRDSFR